MIANTASTILDQERGKEERGMEKSKKPKYDTKSQK